jgi:hypothetical protein
MPSILAHARSTNFAKTHFDLIRNDGGENKIFTAETFAFAKRQRRGDKIAWVTRIGFLIDVVVIHRPNHVAA